MRLSRRHAIAILIAVAMLIPLDSANAATVSLQRTWSAKLSSSTGVVALKAYTSGVGSIRYTLNRLKANATYSVQIRNGTCANLGTIVVRPASLRTTSSGTVSHVTNVSSSAMTRIWSAARKPSFVVRIANGSSSRCGKFTFAHATRVAVSGLGIDLPIIRGPSGYPRCRVAMYLPAVAQPREPGITFLFAHARSGMFLPLLAKSRINGGASLIGRTVRVWTSDSYVSYYQITKVRKTSNPMSGSTVLTRERLWLQTSTGPNTTYPKLVVEASRYKTVKATYAASHPKARPISC